MCLVVVCDISAVRTCFVLFTSVCTVPNLTNLCRRLLLVLFDLCLFDFYICFFFYLSGAHRDLHVLTHSFPTRRSSDLTVGFDGMVEEERTVDVDTLVQAMPLEERVYRHRCVEAWSIVVPWSGFPMAELVKYARPLSSATYLQMQTFGSDQYEAPGFRQFWYPWPYIGGLTMEEATNELAFMATGAYGKPLPAQNGAPLRLSVPWKYGFKSVKSIVRFTFTDKRPVSFWEELGPDEYGFWANVNPEVPHPRWSPAIERVIGTRSEAHTSELQSLMR